MPSQSDSPDAIGGTDIETGGPVEGTRRGPMRVETAPAGDGWHRYHRRVRAAVLAAEVERLAVERELLDERVDALTAEVAALESEVATLERVVESEEQRRQQVIDSYERVVGEGSGNDRPRGTDANGETDRGTATERRGPLAAIGSAVERVVAWLRRADE
jgi:hypothetical protein